MRNSIRFVREKILFLCYFVCNYLSMLSKKQHFLTWKATWCPEWFCTWSVRKCRLAAQKRWPFRIRICSVWRIDGIGCRRWQQWRDFWNPGIYEVPFRRGFIKSIFKVGYMKSHKILLRRVIRVVLSWGTHRQCQFVVDAEFALGHSTQETLHDHFPSNVRGQDLA